MSDGDSEDPAGEPLDRSDAAILSELAALYEFADPVPTGLADRIAFALELDDLEREMARLEERLAVADGARGAEHVRTLTFASESLTVMITITPLRPGGTRLDGWASPGAGLPVELRMERGSLYASADDTGRFAFEQVPAGRIQLVFHADQAADGSGRRQVVTPAVEL